MKKSLLLFVVFVLSTSQLAGQDKPASLNPSVSKHSIKASLLSFATNFNIEYQYRMNKKMTTGFRLAHPYFWEISGIKLSPEIRYYFAQHAPTGWFIQLQLPLGYFETKEYFKTISTTYESNGSIIDTDQDHKKKTVDFFSLGVALQAGRQVHFGQYDQFTFGYRIGFQYFPYYRAPEAETSTYINEQGKKVSVETSFGSLQDAIPVNNLLWYSFSVGSIFCINFSLGYNF